MSLPGLSTCVLPPKLSACAAGSMSVGCLQQLLACALVRTGASNCRVRTESFRFTS
jgi:hypothetical protein